jgi:hypothetical protein
MPSPRHPAALSAPIVIAIVRGCFCAIRSHRSSHGRAKAPAAGPFDPIATGGDSVYGDYCREYDARHRLSAARPFRPLHRALFRFPSPFGCANKSRAPPWIAMRHDFPHGDIAPRKTPRRRRPTLPRLLGVIARDFNLPPLPFPPPSPGSHAGREGKQFLIFKLPILRARPRFAKWRAYARMETQLPADLLSRTDCRLSGRNRESDRKRKRRGGRAVGGGWLRPAVRHRARKRGDLYC